MNPDSDDNRLGRATRAAGELAGAAVAIGVVVLVALALRDLPERAVAFNPAGNMAPGIPAPPPMEPCVMDRPGHLRGTIHGQTAQHIAWQGEGFYCEGTPRPGGAGIRLFFAGRAADDRRVVVVMGVNERPERLAGREHPANITIIDEAASRFYSSGGEDRCWTTVSHVTALTRTPVEAWRVDGVFYCAGALPSLNGNDAVTLEEFSYSGRVVMNDA